MRTWVLGLALSLVSLAAQAAPAKYILDKANSQVSYSVAFGSDEIEGTFPIRRSDISLDFVQNSQSSVKVVLNARNATSSFPFALQALKGPRVLATGNHPNISFDSQSFAMRETSATVDGLVTIRGVTKPLRLDVQVFRQQGTDAGDLSKISVHITGTLNRSDFGASGFSDVVSDKVTINIVARMDRVD